jgi:N6-adenosine-specific RNA methylase IME4
VINFGHGLATGYWLSSGRYHTPRHEHSRKPDEQYARIEALFPGPHLELFARRVGGVNWSAWGNELDNG